MSLLPLHVGDGGGSGGGGSGGGIDSLHEEQSASAEVAASAGFVRQTKCLMRDEVPVGESLLT